MSMETEDKSAGWLLREIKRRKVIRSCVVYVVLCWGAIQVADIIFPALEMGDSSAFRLFLIAAAAGFPVIVALAWFYKLSPEGIVRTTSFVERRVIDNVPPINDRRQLAMTNYFRKDEVEKDEYSWIISAETGPLTGLSYGVTGPMVLGRAPDCDLVIVNPEISRHHARLELEEDNLYVEDMGSSNGTVVNGKMVVGRHPLRHKDEMRFHDIVFRVTESSSRAGKQASAMNETTLIKS